MYYSNISYFGAQNVYYAEMYIKIFIDPNMKAVKFEVKVWKFSTLLTKSFKY